MKTKFSSYLILMSAVWLLIGISCKKTPALPPEYIIEGNVDESLNGKKIYLMDYSLRKNIDSVIVDSGRFVFKGIVDSVRYCHVHGEFRYAPLILESGKITVDLEKHHAWGTPLNQTLLAYTEKRDSIIYMSHVIYNEIKEQEKDQRRLKAKLDSVNAVRMPMYYKIMDDAFDANSHNIVGMIVAGDIAMDDATTGKMDTIFSKLNTDLMQLDFTKRLKARNEVLKKTAVGTKFTDFTIEQPDGTKKSLSDYAGKGKYLLVDFWASWCGPCRGETPNLKEIYSKYKGDKFEILGVAVWDKPEDSQKALAEDKPTWPQILNAQEGVMDIYGINGIPHIMLIGPDGTIIARNLLDDAMKAKVAEVMQ